MRLDKNDVKCYNKSEIYKIKGENVMKWIVLGVIFGVCAIIRGNGVAFS